MALSIILACCCIITVRVGGSLITHLGVTALRIFWRILSEMPSSSSEESMTSGAFIDQLYMSSMIFALWMGVMVRYAGSLSLVTFSFSTGAVKLQCTGGVYDALGTFTKG